MRKSSAALTTTTKEHPLTKRSSAPVNTDSSPGFSIPDLNRLTNLHRQMLLIRRFEERAAQLYGQGLIGGFCHLYIGQEAVAVGAMAVKKTEDTFVTAYRDHGHMLVTGMDPGAVMAELMGKITGTSKGKGGSMHMFDPDKGFWGGHGIVGAQVPFGTGVAFAHKYKEDGGVCMTFMGDGAANQGQVYESFNMAALWQLPIVFVIENNHYGMGTSVERACAQPHSLYRRGEPWGIEGMKVDGMDLLAVMRAFHEALQKARMGQPVLLEVDTYRYRGHSMSDPALYRSKDEVSTVKAERDPIQLFEERLVNEFSAAKADLQKLDKEVKSQVLKAVEFAKSSAPPPDSELYTDILKPTPNSREA